MGVRKRGDKFIAEIYDSAKKDKRWLGTFDTRREAKGAFAAAQLAKDEAPQTPDVDGFAGTWVDRYPRRKESTNEHYRQLARLVARDFEGVAMGDVEPPRARAYALQHQGRWKVARAMFSDAVRDGIIPRNPFVGLRLPESRGRKDLVVPTAAEMDRMIAACSRVWGDYGRRVFGPLLELAAYTGLRPGEWFALRWSDVDLRQGELTVSRQYNAKVRGFTEPKNGRSRTLALHPRAASAVARIPQVREEIASTPRGALFTGRVSKYYFFPVASAVGRPELTPHCLRHYFGTYLARLGPSRGIGPAQIASAMGHTDGGALAARVYVHLTDLEHRATLAKAWDEESVVPLRAVEGEA